MERGTGGRMILSTKKADRHGEKEERQKKSAHCPNIRTFLDTNEEVRLQKKEDKTIPEKKRKSREALSVGPPQSRSG